MRHPALLISVTLWSLSATSKPWHGIEPGVSTRKDVVAKFGEPSQAKLLNGREVLGYLKQKAIQGTKQAQFKIDPKTQRVERIDVFVGPIILRDEVEKAYGAQCPAGPLGEAPCYVLKNTGDKRHYFVYPQLGLAVFFLPDGKTVQSLVFQPVKKDPVP